MIFADIKLDSVFPIIFIVFVLLTNILGAKNSKKKKKQRASDQKSSKPKRTSIFDELISKINEAQQKPAPLKPVNYSGTKKTHFTAQTTEKKETPLAENSVSEEKLDIATPFGSIKAAMSSMKLPSMNMNFMSAGGTKNGSSNIAKIIDPSNKNQVRKAILAQVVLDKPKAFE